MYCGTCVSSKTLAHAFNVFVYNGGGLAYLSVFLAYSDCVYC